MLLLLLLSLSLSLLLVATLGAAPAEAALTQDQQLLATGFLAGAVFGLLVVTAIILIQARRRGSNLI